LDGLVVGRCEVVEWCFEDGEGCDDGVDAVGFCVWECDGVADGSG